MRRPQDRARHRRSGSARASAKPQLIEADSTDLKHLLRELECHSAGQCVDCHVPEVGLHKAVCLTAHEMSLLETLLRRLMKRTNS